MLRDRLGLVVLVRHRACSLPPDNGELHVFDLDADEEEVYPAHDDVFQVVSNGKHNCQSREQ